WRIVSQARCALNLIGHLMIDCHRLCLLFLFRNYRSWLDRFNNRLGVILRFGVVISGVFCQTVEKLNTSVLVHWSQPERNLKNLFQIIMRRRTFATSIFVFIASSFVTVPRILVVFVV